MSYIVGAARTALARGKPGGLFSHIHPVDLYSSALKGVIAKTGVSGLESRVEDVITGVVTPVQKQGANVGRLAALKSGFGIEVPGVQLNRMCGSGQQAIHFASQVIEAGDMDLAIGGGVEMMSVVTMGSDTDLFNPEPTEFKKSFPYKLIHQGISAEMVAKNYGISRAECDEFAVNSHRKAFEATQDKRFESQIIPVDALKEGEVVPNFTLDEGIRYPVDTDKLSQLQTIFAKDGNGVVTAGNASQITDGAAAVLVASDAAVKEHGLKPRARFVARVVVGSDPVVMLDGVIPATEKVLKKAGLTTNDIDVFEVNEAFASVALAWAKSVGVDAADPRFNPNGGAIAHGHPLGATGAVLMTKMINELERTGGRYGLQTMCIGHGMATATIVENLSV